MTVVSTGHVHGHYILFLHALIEVIKVITSLLVSSVRTWCRIWTLSGDQEQRTSVQSSQCICSLSKFKSLSGSLRVSFLNQPFLVTIQKVSEDPERPTKTSRSGCCHEETEVSVTETVSGCVDETWAAWEWRETVFLWEHSRVTAACETCTD